MATHSAPARLFLGSKDSGRYISSREFAEADYEEPWKYEREDGRLVVLAPSGEGHSSVSEPWRDWLGAYRLNHRDVVQHVMSEAWVRVDGATERIGDIGVYLVPDGPVTPRPDRVPDLMFEVISPGKAARDRVYVRKRAEYYRLGVREYVIIDRFRRTVTVLSFAPDGYEERILSVGDDYTSPLLPGLVIPLSEVF